MEWDGDWSEVSSETERTWLEEELAREVCPTHSLYGVRAVALGRRWRRDDVLFHLEDGRFAQVHLTRRPESNPLWPSTEFFASFDAWLAIPVEDR
ncbi:hypothetical protein CA833_17395 [Novosphingobium sp. KA1]|nr:hypothetical protein CA833_17395 [Novosphingobium sp. KA1]